MPWFEDAHYIDNNTVTTLLPRLEHGQVVAVVGEEHAVYGTALEAALRLPDVVVVAGDVHPQMVETHLVARRTGTTPWELPFRTWWGIPPSRLPWLVQALRETHDGGTALDDLQRTGVFWCNRITHRLFDRSLYQRCTLVLHPAAACAGHGQREKLVTLVDLAQLLDARCIATFPVPFGRAGAATIDVVPELIRDQAVLLPTPRLEYDDQPPL